VLDLIFALRERFGFALTNRDARRRRRSNLRAIQCACSTAKSRRSGRERGAAAGMGGLRRRRATLRPRDVLAADWFRAARSDDPFIGHRCER